MEDNNTEISTEETTGGDVAEDTTSDVSDTSEDTGTGDAEADTFPREYVEDLRRENGKYRVRAKRADELAERLHTELVRATGRLADPTDLAFDEAHLGDPDRLTDAIDALLEAKPHLASRRPTGDVGQGPRGAGEPVNLLGLMRQHA